MDHSPELDAYFELLKRIWLRLEQEGRLDEVLGSLPGDSAVAPIEPEKFNSPDG